MQVEAVSEHESAEDRGNTRETMEHLSIPLERDVFLRGMVRELAGSLQDIVGLAEASGFFSIVGQRVGEEINESYKSALNVSSLGRKQVAAVLVDLKMPSGRLLETDVRLGSG